MEISHVTNGIIFCVCSTLTISILQFVLNWCQKERKKNQVKKELQRSRGQWCVLLQGLPQLCHLRRQKARGRKAMEVRVLWFPQMFNPQVVKLYCMCLRTMRLWSKWLWKAEVQHWDMFPEPTELLLIGCLIESIWTAKVQIKYIDTKNHLADILTKRNFTRGEWNHLLCLFNISQFSSINSLEAMSKRTQEDAREESQQNQSRWWIWSHDAAKEFLTCLPPQHQKARWKPNLNVRTQFYQTRCNAIILNDTLPACCISKVVGMKSGEIIYEKVYVSPRPPPTISFKDTISAKMITVTSKK